MGASANANIAELLQRTALDQGNRPAIMRHDGHLLCTFAGLAAASSRLAAGLTDAGLAPGDRVATLVADPADFFLMAAGILWAGATVVVPPRTGELRRMLRAVAAARPRAVVASPAVWSLVALDPALRRVPVRVTTGRWGWFEARSLRSLLTHRPTSPASREPTDPAIVSHTTGTTGQPKPIERTHGVLRAQHEALKALRPPAAGDVDLAGLPLLVLHNLAAGIPSVLPPGAGALKKRTGANLCEALRCTHARTVVGFPSLFEAMVGHAASGELRGLRAIHIGGAQVRPDLLLALAQAAPAAEIVVVYGCTEAEPITAISATEYLARYDRAAAGEGVCVGLPTPGIEVHIEPLAVRSGVVQAASGRASPVVGRVQVAGRRVAVPPVPDGPARRLDTGDVAWTDSDGRLWLMGRYANVAEEGLCPGQIEPVIEALPWTRHAALVNVGTGHGRRPVLAIEPAARGSRADQVRWCDEIETLAATRSWPLAGVSIIGRLPRDARSGSKIDYLSLARLVQRTNRTAWLQ